MSGSQTAGRQMAPGGRLEILERDLKKKKKNQFYLYGSRDCQPLDCDVHKNEKYS